MPKAKRHFSNQPTVPAVGGNDPVNGASNVDDPQDVTSWLIDRLADITQRATDLINNHLASIRPPESGGGIR